MELMRRNYYPNWGGSINFFNQVDDYVQRRWGWVTYHSDFVNELDFLYCVVIHMPLEIGRFYSKTVVCLNKFLMEFSNRGLRALWVAQFDADYAVSNPQLKFYIIFAPLVSYSNYATEISYALFWESQLKEAWRKVLGSVYRRVDYKQREFKFLFPFRPLSFLTSFLFEGVRSTEEYLGSLLSCKLERRLRRHWSLPFGFNKPVSFGVDPVLFKHLGGMLFHTHFVLIIMK